MYQRFKKLNRHSRAGGNPEKMYQEKLSYIYIMASGKNGTLYIGVTSNLAERVYKHKQSLVDGFTKRYNIKNLVYYEIFGDIKEAITREKQLKKWKRDWKIKLIEKNNPGWNDLFASFL